MQENNLKIYIENEVLQLSKSVKNLGVIFHCRLRFDGYVRLLIKKAYLVTANRNTAHVNSKLWPSAILSLS